MREHIASSFFTEKYATVNPALQQQNAPFNTKIFQLPLKIISKIPGNNSKTCGNSAVSEVNLNSVGMNERKY